ncbi:2-keto-4-pentenoate hydratase [Kocuria sp.]|uniref:2-keto-4-pentenoate hydratase n=1 Tax=Kocuria sp. TaxID=1871328 RepID=UPI0026E0E9BF|nr:fumarylacetoacetate hydrolase family protein [Kocuria sp.]MDO5619483.1 fumarylacetoacetate hydrolase family protein [Kocuria sp.]
MSSPISQIADTLAHAELARRPILPLRNQYALTPHDAYAVQVELGKRRQMLGARHVGRKIGLTSEKVQAQLGVEQPDYGALFHDMRVAPGSQIDLATLIQPRIEAEVAFTLADDLCVQQGQGPADLDLDTVRAAIAFAQPALEIVDSRIQNWDIGFVDTVADNGSAALFVLGPTMHQITEVEPRAVQMAMHVDGELVSTGSGTDCLGDPLEAVLWLARSAIEHGKPLRAGEIVLSGALGPMAVIERPCAVTAVVGELGTVSVDFVQNHQESGVSS